MSSKDAETLLYSSYGEAFDCLVTGAAQEEYSDGTPESDPLFSPHSGRAKLCAFTATFSVYFSLLNAFKK